jgi:hypothetical protein
MNNRVHQLLLAILGATLAASAFAQTTTTYATADYSLFPAKMNGGSINLGAADGGIEIASGNDPISFIDFKGNANLSADFRGRLMYGDNYWFTMYNDAQSDCVLMLASRRTNTYLNLAAGPNSDATGEFSFERTDTNKGNIYIGGNAAGNIVFRSGGYAYRMKIDASGNVGIGTTTLGWGTKLQVTGRGLFTGGSFDPGDGSPPGVSISYDGTAGHIEAIQTGVTSKPLEIQHYGNVGIGTASPTAKLDVAGNVRVGGDMILGGNFGGGNKMLLTSCSDTHFIRCNNWWTEFVSHPNQGWKFLSNGDADSNKECFRIVAGSGNVGIGTTNPTNKLEVNGTIRAKEVIVETTGWSDYVFAPGYKLAPLSEVEAHIASNGTLPGIPSAAEVAEKGVSVGDMQAKLLAKVEELTLHVIAQEKRIAQLEAENAALKTK